MPSGTLTNFCASVPPMGVIEWDGLEESAGGGQKIHLEDKLGVLEQVP